MKNFFLERKKQRTFAFFAAALVMRGGLAAAREISQTALTADGNLVVVSARLADDADAAARFGAALVGAAAHHALADFLGPQAPALREIAAALPGAGLAASLPPAVRQAADAADAAARQAQSGLAAAREAALRELQKTDRARAKILADAHAEAAERIAFARSSTATITALEARLNQADRPALLNDLYRERIAAILRQAGSLTTIDPKSISKVIIPDSSP